ncbi:MAG: hypothetical protein ABII82_17805 [Verrucomicrobiota bacterium]
MNNQDAKFYLSAYRPGGADARDPAMAGALEQVRRDPALRTWFEREHAHDAAVAEKLRSVAPPEGLRAAILAGARMSGEGRAWWRQPRWMGLAATLALLATLAGLWFSGWSAGSAPRGPGDLATFALRELGGLHYPAHAREGSPLESRLLAADTRLAEGLAFSPEELRRDGCHVLKVGGLEVFEVCFKRDRYYHLYLVRRDAARVEPGDEMPMLLVKEQRAALTWADDRFVYVLAGAGDGQDLRTLL